MALENKQIYLSIDPGYKNLGWVLAQPGKDTLDVFHQEVTHLCDWEESSPFVLISAVFRWVQTVHNKLLDHLKVKELPKACVTILIEEQYFIPGKGSIGVKLKVVQAILMTVLFGMDWQKVIVTLASRTVKRFFGISTNNRLENKKEMMKVLKNDFNVTLSNEHVADCYLLLLYHCTNFAN